MSTWQDVDRSLDPTPVRAPASDFEVVASQFQGFEQSSRSVVADFCRLTAGDTARFEGKAAAAFISTLGTIADDMRDLPSVAGSIAVIFRDHAAGLKGLQAEVDRALAVAVTTKAERDVEAQAVGSNTTALASIRGQLASLRGAGAEESDPQVTSLTARERSKAQDLSSARVRLSARTDDVRASVDQYHRFRDREDELNRSTAQRIRTVDLGSMSDPSNLEKLGGWTGDVFEGFVDYLKEFVSDLVDMVDAAMHGDWNEFFWRLNDALRVIVTVVGLVLAVAALIIPGAGILIAGAIVGVVLAGALFATSAGLAVKGRENSETDRRMDSGTVALDGAGLLLAVVGAGLLSRGGAFHGMKFSKFHKGRFFHRSVHGPDGRFVKKPVADAFRREQLQKELLDKVKDRVGDQYNEELQSERGPFPSVRLAPPSSCSSGSRVLIGAAA